MIRKLVVFVLLLLTLSVTINAQETATPEPLLDKQVRAQERIEKRASRAAELSAKRAEFREKLQTIRDQKKQVLVQRIDTKFSTINQKRTDRWVEVLEKLSSISARLDQKIASEEAAGKDVSTAQSALESANDAIATAQSTVSSQAGKEYTIEITSETGLKLAVGKVMSQLQTDLRATHKTVVDAKQAVMKAAREVKKLKGQGAENESTSSAIPE